MAQLRLNRLEAAYNEAEYEVVQLQATARDFEPRRITGGEITQQYADAVRMLPIAEYYADQAQSDLYDALKLGHRDY